MNETAKKTATALAKTNTPKPPANTLWSQIKALSPSMALMSPNKIPAEKLERVFYSTISRNPDLARCSFDSLKSAMLTCCALGVEPGILGQAYFVPFKNQCTFIIGVNGLVELARRSGKISRIETHTIYQSDVDSGRFSLTYGTGGRFKLEPSYSRSKADDQPIAYVAYLQYKDGSEAYTHMTFEEICEHRNKFALSKGGPWANHFGAMAAKTVLRKLLKRQSLSPELQRAAAFDEQVLKAPEKITDSPLEDIVIDVDDENGSLGTRE